jgi:2-polyprenyl-6-methoxyphenol hydroxylase-like FAD-dependent oxidoreductase
MFWLTISLILGIISYIVYKKQSKSVKFTSSLPQYDHAIIIGGSIGGIVTAAYLSKYFSRITIIESDDVLNTTLIKSTPNEILDYRCRLESPTSLGRSGVGQIYQLHVVEGEGYKILLELFPQLGNKLLNEHGIRTYSLKTEARFVIDGVLLNQDLLHDIRWLGADRFTLETVLRQELCSQFGNQIEWKCNTRVTQLIVDQSLNTVKGIKYRSKQTVGSPSFDMYGDFIIDCTGRHSSSTKWLKESFDLNVPREQIHFGCGYVTFIGERFKTGDPSLDLKPVFCTTVNAPVKNTGCYITPIRTLKTMDENSLGVLAIIAVHCVNSEYPPNDSYENLLEWTKEHLDPEYYSILKSTKVHSPLVLYRRAIDDRKYVELLGKKWPQNYIILGDAMCTFNPQYGQSMTHACRQARELDKIFDENCHKLKDISHIFNRRASAISDECWLVSTANDWKTPTLKVIKTDKHGEIKTYQRGGDSIVTNDSQPRPSLIIQFLQWYNRWFLDCASRSGQLSTDFMHVVNQYNSPFLLLKPTTFLVVCHTALMNYFSLPKKISA